MSKFEDSIRKYFHVNLDCSIPHELDEEIMLTHMNIAPPPQTKDELYQDSQGRYILVKPNGDKFWLKPEPLN